MKNSQKGPAFLLVLAIIAVLVIGGGAYLYSRSIEQSGPTSYINNALVSRYSVVSEESLWRGKYVSTNIPVEWSVPSKKVTIKKITENTFSCGGKQIDLVNYSSYSAGSNYIGGWNSISILDCGSYYFVYESGDAGPKLYGPFDFQTVATSTNVTSSQKPTPRNEVVVKNSPVAPKVHSISPNALPDGSTNVYYNQHLDAVGFSTSTLSWKIVAGSLPAGFYLEKTQLACTPSYPSTCGDQSTVMFKASMGGMPTQEGIYPFTVKVENGNESATKSYTITIKPGFAIQTDKVVYSLDEPIVMTMMAYNQTADAKVFTFQTSCQTSYRINNLNGSNFFDSMNNPSCSSTSTSVTVPAFGTYSWKATHNPATYRVPPGTYRIMGWIIGQARFDSAPITITD
jgi:hypothetical protein